MESNNSTYKRIAAIFLMFFVSQGCLPIGDGTVNPSVFTDPTKVQEVRNIVYNSKGTMLNLILPPGRTVSNTPIIVFLPGGAWATHNKDIYCDQSTMKYENQNSFINKAVNLKKYGVAVIDYAHVFFLNTSYLNQLSDIKEAINFLSSKSSEWHFSPNNFIIGGQSAGGHLALLYASKEIDDRIKGIFSYQGPPNLTDDTTLTWAHNTPNQTWIWLQNMANYSPVYNTTVNSPIKYTNLPLNLQFALKNTSPIYNINSSLPPIKLIYGQKDAIVYYKTFVAYFNSLQLQNNRDQSKDEIQVLPNGVHGQIETFNDNYDNRGSIDGILNWIDDKIF